MKRLPIFLGSALALFGLSLAAIAPAATSTVFDTDQKELPIRVRSNDHMPEYFNAAPNGLARAPQDTVYLLGGPNSVTGKFQTLLSNPGGQPDPQGWVGVDRTEVPNHWNISTFNAENLGGVGNNAIWAGVPAGTPGYTNAPGYGNGWDDQLVFTAQVASNQTNDARLRFVFNYDTEATYDFFFVDYDSAGTWVTMATYDGTNGDGAGNFVSAEVFDQQISLAPATAGQSGDELRFRLRFTSDSAASDEDGFIDTFGAVQIDNIIVNLNGAEISRAEFEGGADDADWVVTQAAFAGEFATLFSQFSEVDPCRTNITPAFGFIDFGQEPSNAPGRSTGGQLSTNWDYGIPGGWVVNFTGGISGETPIDNEIWSPELDWDLPGTDDDGAIGGAFLRITLWEHVPLVNGIFWHWNVRSIAEGGEWTPWSNRNLVTYEDLQQYAISRQEVADLLVQDPDRVQISLGVIDLASVFGLPGGDSTPAPIFDNISFARYRVAGPAITSSVVNRFNDGFPQSGASWSPGVDKNDLAIRLDAGRDLVRSQGSAIVAGDSMVINAVAVLPGTDLAGPPVLKWVLDANPFFDDVRTMPAGATILTTFTGRDGRTWNRWQGEVIGGESTNTTGSVVADTYFFDMPDGNARTTVPSEVDEPGFFFPGDQFRYYFESTDTDGNTTTAPGGLTDPGALATFQDGTWGIVGRGFMVNGLPSYLDPDDDGTPEQPNILYVNDFGHRGSENDFLAGFNQNGLFEGLDFDCYTTQRPDSGLSNSIGTPGAHGASADQLRGYDTIFYDAGDLTGALGDGQTAEDKSQDVQILTQWKNLPGERFTVHFGDYIAWSLANGNTDAITYLSNTMGVSYVGIDMRGAVGGQTAPVATPTGNVPGVFSTDFIAFGGCLGINEFDNIEPLGGAVRSHEFLTADGIAGAYDPAAGVWYDRQIDGDRKVDVTFPFGVNVLWTGSSRAPQGSSAIARVFAELLDGFGQVIDDSDATSSPSRLPSAMLGNQPNPFNPSTQIKLRMGVPGNYTLRIYNVRGELVRTLLNEDVQAGQRSITWDGTDETGNVVGSGVYLTKFVGPDINTSSKLMLVK